MKLSAERRAALMQYCRLDDLNNAGIAELEMMYAAAVGYMEDAGVGEPPENTLRRAQYDLCVNCLVLDAWDQRGLSISGAGITENPAFRRRINQLKITEPDVSNLDTSGG